MSTYPVCVTLVASVNSVKSVTVTQLVTGTVQHLLEQMMFQLAPEGRQRISQNDVVRQAVPELGSGDHKGSTADCRQFDWWHLTRRLEPAERNARRPGRSATRTNGPM